MTRLSARNQETTRRGGSTTLAAVIGAWTLAATLSSAIWGLEPSHTLDQYVSRSWGLESGMPQLTVNAIVQTPDHYLWVGTFGGLARFDGVRFEIFGLEQGLESLRILSLMVDREGTLWVGTEDAGVARLSPGSRHFVHHESIPLTPVWALAEDPNGGVWIGTSDGLLHSDGQSARPFAPSGSPPLTDISSLSIDGRGRLWVGARGDGLAVLDGDTLHTVPLPQAAQWVLALTVSDDGDLWAYTGAGLIHIENDSAQQVSRHDDSRAPKAAILADDGGSLWFGGLELSRWAGGETTPAQGDLAGTTIRALFQDIEGTLWVGTDRRGLYQLSDGPLTTYSTTEGIVGRAVLPVTEGPDGAIWVGTRCGGLSRFDGRRFQPVLYDEQTPENCVHSLLTASDGTLWISDSQGLAALRGETLTRYGREQGLPVGSPRALMEDGAGRLWIGTWSGLYRLEGGHFTRFGTADGLADERVLFITEDDAGALWIGSDSGLSRFQNDVFTAYDQASGLPPGAVRAILATGGEVWIGTYGGGLARLEDGVFTRYTTADGLYDEAISSILADGEGHLWLCGNRGLFNVSRIELEAFARGEISRIRSIAFGASDGMKSPECNGGGQPSGWKSSDGRLWFATIHGVSVVNPGKPWSPQIPPTVIGEEIVTGGRRLFPDGGITVGPGRDLEVHYTGISLAAPERVTFRYRLDGFDTDWIEVGSRRAAYYTNLPGGRYRFEVEAGFDGHRWGSQPFRVDVHVQPRFFETPLFVGLAVLLVILTFLVAHRLRIRHLKARDAELSALVAERTRELLESQRQLEQLNRRKNELLGIAAHDLRNPLGAIHTYSEILQREPAGYGPNRKFLGSIHSLAAHTLELVNQLLDVSAIEAGLVNVHPAPFELAEFVDETVALYRALATEKEMEIELLSIHQVSVHADRARAGEILSNLLSNAVKFTPSGGRIQVWSDLVDNDVALFVRDSGPGLPTSELDRAFRGGRLSPRPTAGETSTGFGLLIVRKLVELHGGRVEVHNNPGEGATFSFTLPRAA